MYTQIAPMLALPGARQARKIRAKENNEHTYLPGLNEWVFTEAGKREHRPMQNGMDGTRVTRAIELYMDTYLVGEEFRADVRLYPNQSQLPIVESWEQVRDYVLNVRQMGKYAPEAYSICLTDTTGKLPDLLLGSIPEAKEGVSGAHVFALMMEVEKNAAKHGVSLVGHCTDSASNALSGLRMLASPKTYDMNRDIQFLGLPREDFVFFAPMLRCGYPSIAYPCWDHSGRTVVRNLMNSKISVVAGVVPAEKNQLQLYSIATINDLHTLKGKFPGAAVRYSDITPYLRQNCDATVRIISQTTIDQLRLHVPESKATQLYLKAALWTHEPC